jgi:hypothetical protein
MRRALSVLATCAVVAGCAGTQRGCASFNAGTFGADWIVVQYSYDGEPITCWELRGVSVAVDPGNDLHWVDTKSGHLIHLEGWYNRIQVAGGDFVGAAKTLGVDPAKCGNGKYPSVG